MASDRDIIVFPQQERKSFVHSMTINLVVTCRCGSEVPLLIAFIPGVPLTPFCPACKLEIRLGRLIYDAEKGDQLIVGLIENEPRIVIPAKQIPS